MSFSIIAALPNDPLLRARYLRRLQQLGGGELLTFAEETEASEALADALERARFETLLMLDGKVLPHPTVSSIAFRTDAAGGFLATPAGVCVGHLFEQSEAARRGRIFEPVLVPATEMLKSREPMIDLVFDGALLTTRTAVTRAGGLRRDLPPRLAMIDLQISMRAAGLSIGVSGKLQLDRPNGVDDQLLADQQAVMRLRRPEQWRHIIRSSARRVAHLPVRLYIHGASNAALRAEQLEHAGYPLETIVDVADEAAADLLREAFLQRAGGPIVLLDSEARVEDEWLLSLIEELHESPDVGIVTLGDTGTAGPIDMADARATLMLLNRFSADFTPAPHGGVDALVRDASLRGAQMRVATRATAASLGRPAGEALAPKSGPRTVPASVRPMISIVVVATSRLDSHRFNMDSLRTTSRQPYELLFVVGNTQAALKSRLVADPMARVFSDADDETLASGINRALAAADGAYVALVSDEIITGHRWLDDLENVLERMPRVGIAAPSVTRASGEQAAQSMEFSNLAELRIAVKSHAEKHARRARSISTLTAPAFLARQDVFARIGGFDRRLGCSTAGLLDFSRRAALAGFEIALAEDVFVHRVEVETTHANLRAFDADTALTRFVERKWRVDDPRPLMVVPLTRPEVIETVKETHIDRRMVSVVLPIVDERAWQRQAPLVKKLLRLFSAADHICLGFTSCEDVTSSQIAMRLRGICDDAGIDMESSLEVIIADTPDVDALSAELPAGERILAFTDPANPALPALEDHSPSGLRRALLRETQEKVSL